METEKQIIAKKRYIEIRYEDFVMNPHRTLQDVFCRLRLCNSPSAHWYLTSIGKVKNMNYKFKKHLTEKEIMVVENITRAIATEAGYQF